ncbi:hypothetical protein H4R34_002043 [Dimargaris verticillata]|uniref:Uncharacterized protein n=1 Tax=Dimargaris verticillata TaxID=2761393 RepID=A0A9W8B3I3_9FUNG|nr:hypothetical protein H4R34_002043 [Dimargaris verticillata]
MYQELSTNAGLVPWDLGASNNATTLRQVSPWTALCEFIEHIVKQFFARLSTEPMLFMEVLFSHTRLECLRPDLQQVIKPKSSRRPATAAVASSSEEASHDFDNFVATCRFDFAVLRRHEEEHGHIAVPPHFPWSHKLGAVIGILLYRQLGAAVQWVKQALAEAKAQRNQHISEESNEPASSAPLATIPDYVLARSSEHYGALQHHPQLAELLRLVGFHYVPSIESSDQPDDGVSMGSWVLITAVPIADLDLNIQTIDEYVISPLGPDGTPLPRTAPSKSKKKAPRHIRRHPVSPCSGSDNENDSLQVHTKRLPRQRKGKPKRKPSSKAQPMHTSDDGVPVSNAAEPLGGTGSSQALGFNDQPKRSASLARKVSALALSTSPDTSEVEAALESSDDPSSSGGDSNAQFMRPSLPVRPKPLVSREPMSSPSADRPTLSPPTKRIRRLKNRHFQENDTVWPSSPPDALQPDQDALLVHSRSVSGVDYSPHKAERVSTGGVAVSHSQLAPSDEQNSETDLDEAIDGLDTGAAPTISIARTRNVYQSRRRTMGIVSDSE